MLQKVFQISNVGLRTTNTLRICHRKLTRSNLLTMNISAREFVPTKKVEFCTQIYTVSCPSKKINKMSLTTLSWTASSSFTRKAWFLWTASFTQLCYHGAWSKKWTCTLPSTGGWKSSLKTTKILGLRQLICFQLIWLHNRKFISRLIRGSSRINLSISKKSLWLIQTKILMAIVVLKEFIPSVH